MMFAFADQDGDGKLSFGEFLKVMNPPKIDKDKNESVYDEQAIVEVVNEVEKEENEEASDDKKAEKSEAGAEDNKVVKFTENVCDNKDEVGDKETQENAVEKKEE